MNTRKMGHCLVIGYGILFSLSALAFGGGSKNEENLESNAQSRASRASEDESVSGRSSGAVGDQTTQSRDVSVRDQARIQSGMAVRDSDRSEVNESSKTSEESTERKSS